MQRFSLRLLVLGAALECGFAGMLLTRPGPGRVVPYLVLFLAAFALYLAGVRIVLSEHPEERGPAASGAIDPTGLLVVGGALLFRLTFLAASPALGDDLYRYFWDGRVALAGGNPYLEEPAPRASVDDPVPIGMNARESSSPGASRMTGSARADALPGGEEFARIEHKEIPTIYPPVAQALFLAGAALHIGVVGIKILVVVADLLVVIVLRGLLRARGQPSTRALIYAWNPLAVTEASWSGHLEPVAIVLALVAACGIIQKRDGRATLALTLAGLVKLFPFVLFVPFLRSIRGRVLLLVPLLVVAAYWPFRAAGWRVLAGTREYADRWLGNESLFAIIRAAIAGIDPTEALKTMIARARSLPHTGVLDRLYAYVYPTDLAKGVCALLLLALAVAIWRRRVEPLRGCFVLTGALLLLSPTVHPWYVLWILPWLCFFPSRAFLLLTGLASLAYLNLGAAPGSEPYPLARVAEYAPVYALLCADWIGARRRAARGLAGGGARVLDSNP